MLSSTINDQTRCSKCDWRRWQHRPSRCRFGCCDAGLILSTTTSYLVEQLVLEFIISEIGSGLLCWIYDMTDSQAGAANHAVCLLYKTAGDSTPNENWSAMRYWLSLFCYLPYFLTLLTAILSSLAFFSKLAPIGHGLPFKTLISEQGLACSSKFVEPLMVW